MRGSLFFITLIIAAYVGSIHADSLPSSTAFQPMRPLTVEVRNLKSDTGNVRFVLFSKATARSWDSRHVIAGELAVHNRRCVWITPPLPDGVYALAVFHDRNGNKELDKNVLGVPVEPYGFSNDARGTLGPPSIDKAWFVFDHEHREIVIILHN